MADDLYPGERGDDYPTTDDEQRRLSQLIPAAESRMRAILMAMAARGMPAYVGETERSQEAQDAAVASGHSSAGEHHGWHELRRACDFRKRLPGDHADPTTHDEAFFRALYEEATIAGCRSLAFRPDGSKLLIQTVHGEVWDGGHVEFREPYLSLAEAWAAEGPPQA